MIKINLLAPAEAKKRKKQVSTGGSYGAIFVLVLVLELLGLYYWGDSKSAQVEEQAAIAAKLKSEVEAFEKIQKQQDELKKKIEAEQQQAEIFTALNDGKVGPSNLLLYLSYILTPPPLENREERVVQEQLGWNTGWDTTRAWFTEVRYGNNATVIIKGQAIKHKDMDEVMRRLRCSIYLQNLALVSSVQTQTKEKNSKASYIVFEFKADVNYNLEVGKVKEEAAAAEGDPKAAGAKKPDKG